MNKDLDLLYLVEYVEDKIQPYTLNSIGKNIINNYIKALRKNNWIDEQILEDLNKEVINVSK